MDALLDVDPTTPSSLLVLCFLLPVGVRVDERREGRPGCVACGTLALDPSLIAT